MPMRTRPSPLCPLALSSILQSPVITGPDQMKGGSPMARRRGVNAATDPSAAGITASVIQKLQGDDEAGI